MNAIVTWAGIAAALLTGDAAGAADIHVPSDQPTIQQAIDASSNGDRVLVAPGSYKENIDFHGKNIQVTSTHGAGVTEIHGNRLGSVVKFVSGESREAVLSGFALRWGYFTDAQPYGGGVLIMGSSPTIAQNFVTMNDGCGAGGGLAAIGGSPLIRRNRFHLNVDLCEGMGAGIYLQDVGHAIVEDNVIDVNWGASRGAGITAIGWGRATIVRNKLHKNRSLVDSSAMYLAMSHVAVRNNLVVHNQHGSIIVDQPNGTDRIAIINNTIADNDAPTELDIAVAGELHLANNIVRSRHAAIGIGCSWSGPTSPRVVRNLVHGATGENMAGNCPSKGRIAANPRFAGGPGQHEFWLAPDSPAIDAGHRWSAHYDSRDLSGQARILGRTVDLGAFEYRQD